MLLQRPRRVPFLDTRPVLLLHSDSGLLRQQREEEERDVGLAIFLHRSRCARKIYINHWAFCCSSRFNKLGDYDESEANVHHQRKARHADKRER